jgi:alginate O-acetyltransferase complex protein AlgI
MSHLRPTVRHVYVMAVVIVGWVFFRADTLRAAVAFLKVMTGLTTPQATPLGLSWYLTPELILALIGGVIGSMPIVPVVEKWRASLRVPLAAPALDVAAGVALSVVLAFSIIQCAAGSYNPFIYFRF